MKVKELKTKLEEVPDELDILVINSFGNIDKPTHTRIEQYYYDRSSFVIYTE